LLEGFEDELRSKSLGVAAGSQRAKLRVLTQCGVDLSFLVGVGNLDWLKDSGREARRAVPLLCKGRIGFEAADHDRIELLAIWVGTTRKSLVVKQFQEGTEAFPIAVMRCGSQKQLVFEVRSEIPEGLRSHRVRGVLPTSRWSAVVGFVADQQIV